MVVEDVVVEDMVVKDMMVEDMAIEDVVDRLKDKKMQKTGKEST